jgi:polyhydroxyalkanoate synthesis repressor PhaR
MPPPDAAASGGVYNGEIMRVIKKYPNRRLYDTERSAYIKLAEVHTLIRDNTPFQVVDAETGEDITRSILIQIIIEQENGEKPIFTTDMLTRFIRFYDDASHGLFGEFLDNNLQFFADQQSRLTHQVEDLLGTAPLPRMMQDMTERNLALWQDMQQKFFDLATGVAPKKKKAE